MCHLTKTALKAFLAQKFKDENDCLDTTELDQDIEAGQKAADTVCQYVDWLLSTINPNPPDEDMWIRPETLTHVKDVIRIFLIMRNNLIM